MDEQMGMELNEANLDSVLDEIRPYLVGALHARHVYVVITKIDSIQDCTALTQVL